METAKDRMEMALQQEAELQFSCFTNKMAWDLGSLLIRRAEEAGYNMTIDIRRGGQQLFHYSMEGTAPDNDAWVAGKVRVVDQMHHSSFYVFNLLEDCGEDIDTRLNLSHYAYRPMGGCFPLIVKNVGVVGTITVSGLPQEEDHAFCVEGIRAYLKSLE